MASDANPNDANRLGRDPFDGLAAKLATMPERLADALEGIATNPEPGPRETCPTCRRPMPDTALEIWLSRNGESFESLAAAATEHPIVLAYFEGRDERPRPISKNLVWRLNHQAPGWKPSAYSPASAVLPAMLDMTKLELADLVNRKPMSNGYACGDAAYQKALYQESLLEVLRQAGADVPE
jgi:hypothetical protein